MAWGDTTPHYYLMGQKTPSVREGRKSNRVTWDMLEVGMSVVLDAPFGVELADANWWSWFNNMAE